MRHQHPIPAELSRPGFGSLGAIRYQGADGIDIVLEIPADFATTPYHLVVDDVTGLPSWVEDTGGGGGTIIIGEILQDDDTGEILYDDDTGEILYEEVTGTDFALALGDLTDVSDTVTADAVAGDVLTFDGAEWVPGLGSTQDTADATTYVATTGNDTTGDGSSGNPYLTVAKALSTLPRSIGFVQTIDVADGTYAEAIVLDDFVCTGAGKILITGNTTTPANVTFTGTDSTVIDVASATATVIVKGPVVAEIEGLRVNAAGDYGIVAQSGARLTIDRCTSVGACTQAIIANEYAHLNLQGDITLSGFTARGINVRIHSTALQTVAGTITITGADGGSNTQNGILVTKNSQWSSRVTGCSITITGVQIGIQCAAASYFEHRTATGTITIDNASTPTSSRGVLCNDVSSWSTTQTVVLDHFTVGFYANSIAYIEAAGTRTLSNLGTTDTATQNSVIYLP
jgi:hypothetical protein